VWHLRNIALGPLSSSHSKAEIAPPIEGLILNLKRPPSSVSDPTSEGFISKLFTGWQLRWG